MRKFLLGTAGLLALGIAAPASAADMAVKAPPPAPLPVIYNWSGFYIGANGGWGQSHNCWDFVFVVGPAFRDGCRDLSGGVVGGQVGYRWQASQWVFGLEAQGDWANFSSSRISLLDPTLSTRVKTDGLGLFTGQIGYAWNAALFYVKGGAAVTADRFRIRDVGTNLVVATTGDDTRWGAAVGAGLEFGFAPNWSAGVEYNHLFMQDRTHTFVDTTGAFFGTDRIRQDVDIVTARINYRFGGPGLTRY